MTYYVTLLEFIFNNIVKNVAGLILTF